jgi:hypothetical protein
MLYMKNNPHKPAQTNEEDDKQQDSKQDPNSKLS